ncbi:NAD(P)H-dependent oxidoreductase [Amaricoccus sp.]|uniref:NADPH-dependent FMN reductase n=1 Tax=Amaricoccus sp. TaxID=1872485 RepID=UPI0026036559|nr:NAD(P)H-dependent oxidoreductase [uncultured Amaricoccus sp.]
MAKPRIAVIIGSTRAARFGDKPAKWIFDLAAQRSDWEVELVDLRDFDLPMFDEAASNAWVPSKDPRAVAWQKKLATFDGFIFVTAEYNHSVPGVLKNALDQAYVEWVRKPAAVFGYGSMGGARAAEHLRMIAIELQMVPTRFGVHIGGGDFFQLYQGKATLADIEEHILPAAKAMLDDLDWWTRATMAARAA